MVAGGLAGGETPSLARRMARAWGETGKIPEYRHPLNGYRLYRQEDLEEVVQQLEQMEPQPVKKGRPKPR